MAQYTNNIERLGFVNGFPCTVRIYKVGTTTPANIFGQNGNVIEVGADGILSFEAFSGTYDFYVERYGTVKKFTDTVAGQNANEGIISAVSRIKTRAPTILNAADLGNIFVGHVDTVYP